MNKSATFKKLPPTECKPRSEVTQDDIFELRVRVFQMQQVLDRYIEWGYNAEVFSKMFPPNQK